MRAIGAVPVSFKKMMAKLKKFSIGKWAFLFILMFLILLLTSAVLVAVGNTVANEAQRSAYFIVADATAILSYFSLLVGVILQIIYFSKRRKLSEQSSEYKGINI
jgi:hypothetical protein